MKVCVESREKYVASRVMNRIGGEVGESEAAECAEFMDALDTDRHAILTWASCGETLYEQLSSGKIVCIEELPPAIKYEEGKYESLVDKHGLQFVADHVSVYEEKNVHYHLIPELVANRDEIVLCAKCTKNPLASNCYSVANGYDYGRYGSLPSLSELLKTVFAGVPLFCTPTTVKAFHDVG